MLGARVQRIEREALNGHRAGVVFLTGLSGAGKTTLASLLDRHLMALGLHSYVLDGDELRRGLCKDLGFSEADRIENLRRAADVARLMVDAGLLVISALIAPFAAERAAARARFAPGDFMEVFVDTPLAVCEARDPKGLYRRARRGELAGFTGIDSPYERPVRAELRIDAAHQAPGDSLDALLRGMRAFGLLTREPHRMAS